MKRLLSIAIGLIERLIYKKAKMINLKEIFLTPFVAAIEAIGAAGLVEGLDQMKKDESPEDFAQIIKVFYANFSIVLKYAKKTKTKIDDAVVQTILDAVKQVADENNISL